MVKELIEYIKPYGFDIGLFIVGALGAAMLSSKGEKLTKKQRRLAIFFGGITSLLVTPLVISITNQLLHIEISDAVIPGAGFIIGHSGLEGFKQALKFWANKNKDK